jgi:hypothetical protein
MQLHRDSTISSLTSSPTLVGGKIIWEDSPLIRAIKYSLFESSMTPSLKIFLSGLEESSCSMKRTRHL